jgi:hypothetical protein
MQVNGPLQALAALPPVDIEWLAGAQSRSEHCGEAKNLASAGIRTPTVQPVAIPIELSRLYIPTHKDVCIHTHTV